MVENNQITITLLRRKNQSLTNCRNLDEKKYHQYYEYYDIYMMMFNLKIHILKKKNI